MLLLTLETSLRNSLVTVLHSLCPIWTLSLVLQPQRPFFRLRHVSPSLLSLLGRQRKSKRRTRSRRCDSLILIRISSTASLELGSHRQTSLLILLRLRTSARCVGIDVGSRHAAVVAPSAGRRNRIDTLMLIVAFVLIISLKLYISVGGFVIEL